jgi:FMN phosphatase YigB (HAD superfamily)
LRPLLGAADKREGIEFVTRFNAVFFDNGDTLFHKPLAAPAVAELASSIGHPIDEACAVEAYQAVKAHKRSLCDEALLYGRNRSAEGHFAYYTACYAPLDDIAPGLAVEFYRNFKTNPASMIPYPDTERTLRALREAGVAVGIVSNTGWDIRQGYERSGVAGMVDSFVLSFEHGVAKPERGIWELACAELGVDPSEVLMVGNNPRADSGAVELGCTCLVLPAVGRGEIRGLDAVLDLVGVERPAALPAA